MTRFYRYQSLFTQNNQLRKDLDETKEKNAAINELLKSLRKDNEELVKANKALANTVKNLKAKKVNRKSAYFDSSLYFRCSR